MNAGIKPQYSIVKSKWWACIPPSAMDTDAHATDDADRETREKSPFYDRSTDTAMDGRGPRSW